MREELQINYTHNSKHVCNIQGATYIHKETSTAQSWQYNENQLAELVHVTEHNYKLFLASQNVSRTSTLERQAPPQPHQWW